MLTLGPRCLDSYDRPRSRTYASKSRNSVKIKELLVVQQDSLSVLPFSSPLATSTRPGSGAGLLPPTSVPRIGQDQTSVGSSQLSPAAA